MQGTDGISILEIALASGCIDKLFEHGDSVLIVIDEIVPLLAYSSRFAMGINSLVHTAGRNVLFAGSTSTTDPNSGSSQFKVSPWQSTSEYHEHFRMVPVSVVCSRLLTLLRKTHLHGVPAL